VTPEPRDRAEGALEGLRVLMGAIWVANLLFIVIPAAGYWSTFASVAASYGPSSLGGAGFAEFVSTHPLVFAWIIALVTAYLAVAFLFGFTTRLACIIGFGFSLAFLLTQWGQTVNTPGGTDVGAHPLYMLVYAVLFAGGAGSSWSVDARLAGRTGLARILRWIGSPGPRPPQT